MLFFYQPGPVPAPDRPGPGSIHRARPGFKTLLQSISIGDSTIKWATRCSHNWKQVSQFIEVGIYMCGLRNDFTVAFVHLFSSSSKSFSRDFSFPTTLKYIYIYIYIYKETDDRKEKMAI